MALYRVSILVGDSSGSDIAVILLRILLGWVRPSLRRCLNGTHVVFVEMSDDSTSDVTEILSLYVLQLAEFKGCISVALYRISMLLRDNSTSNVTETLQPYCLRWLSQ